MRKLFFILMAATLILALSYCNGGGGKPVFDVKDSIPKATAHAMYLHYMDSIVDRSDSSIIRQIFPSVACMKQVLKTKHLTGIKFIVAAYLDTDSIPARRNRPMILLQMKTEKGGTVTYTYYDLNTASQPKKDEA